MFAINTINWANGGMADTQVLGTCLARGFGSSPNSPTRKATSLGLVDEVVSSIIKICCDACCVAYKMLQ